jgi:hypothetical protein
MYYNFSRWTGCILTKWIGCCNILLQQDMLFFQSFQITSCSVNEAYRLVISEILGKLKKEGLPRNLHQDRYECH